MSSVTRTDQVQSNVRYVGELAHDATDDTAKPVWRVRREIFVAGAVATEFALDAQYVAKWDNRLTYFTTPLPAEPIVPSPIYQSAQVRVTTTNVLLVSVVVAVANTKRKAYKIWNNSANSGYLVWGSTASSATPTKILATFTTWEPSENAVYTGIISAIRNAGSGTMTVFELE